jgi:ribonuclease BN (tRNA processing enzyme)
VRLSVIGGCGAWPAAGQACSGYLIEHDGFRLLIDPGYAVVPRLFRLITPGEIDAVFVTHRHPDHCADLNPLLRARVMSEQEPPPLPVFSPPHALDAVLALDRREWLAAALSLQEFEPGSGFGIGPFDIATRLLPHSVPNAGVRVSAGGRTIAYTGDTGPSPEVVELARHADVLLAEASYVDDDMPDDLAGTLSTARQAGEHAASASVGRLLLTHLIPGTDPGAALEVAREAYAGDVSVASHGLIMDLAADGVTRTVPDHR